MKVLVIGSGGREHALAWKLSQSPRVQKVFVAPGNGGTAVDPKLHNIALVDHEALADFARSEKIALTVVGPEAPLAGGIVDLFRARGLRIFGPSKAAAELESSKAFAKDFMARYKIPTAAYATFTDPAAAHAHVVAAIAASNGAPVVVKADGLAAGKGVVVATSAEEAHQAIDWMLEAGAANPLGVVHNDAPRVVIEEFLEGEEASFIVLCDGKNVISLATSQDHKRLQDDDQGPNTGGMGAYSPAPVVTPNIHAKVMQEIILPTIHGMAKDGHLYTGFLYAGLMIDAKGRPRTVEFNCRLGDPEAQVVLMRLKSDLFEVLMHGTAGTLDQVELKWDRRVALGVVMAAHGYPLAPRRGDRVHGIPVEQLDAIVFQAGTALADSAESAVSGGDQAIVVTGGRVLCVTALGDSTKLAQQRAYDVLRGVHFDGAQYRRDIGHRAIKR